MGKRAKKVSHPFPYKNASIAKRGSFDSEVQMEESHNDAQPDASEALAPHDSASTADTVTSSSTIVSDEVPRPSRHLQTKGKLIQKQKREYFALREKIREMRKDRSIYAS